jgi:hypothetical protein
MYIKSLLYRNHTCFLKFYTLLFHSMTHNSQELGGGIRILLLLMLDEVRIAIGIRFEEEEQHKHRHGRADPDNLQDKYQDTPGDNGEVHRDDSTVGGEKLLVDVAGSLWPLVPVRDVRVQVVRKEKGTGEPEGGIRKIHGPEEPGLDDKRVISPVEETIVEGEEPGKEALVIPDKPGGYRLCPATLPDGFFHLNGKGCCVRSEQRDNGEKTDCDTLRPVDEHHRSKIPVAEDGEYDGDEVRKDERDDGGIVDEIARKNS